MQKDVIYESHIHEVVALISSTVTLKSKILLNHCHASFAFSFNQLPLLALQGSRCSRGTRVPSIFPIYLSIYRHDQEKLAFSTTSLALLPFFSVHMSSLS